MLGVVLTQKSTLAPNCTCRIAPADVIRPKFVEPNDAFGLPQFTVLNRLNISTRICTVAPPPSTTFYMSDRSVFTYFGPRRMLRSALPKVNCAGNANAAAS